VEGAVLMKRKDVLVQCQPDLEAVSALLVEGWVADPVLMPTGRPNVVEGVGAIYHLVLADLEGGADVQLYMQRSKFAEPEPPKRVGEFEGADLTADCPHGVKPEGEGWAIHAVYQKNVIWLRRVAPAPKEAVPQ